MSNSGKSDSAKVALAYIESLTARFENAERHINDDIEAIEKRLTQLVELMKTVSTMQQQVTNQQQILAELRMRSFFQRHDGEQERAARQRDETSAANIAWLLWGGDPGRKWAAEVLKDA